MDRITLFTRKGEPIAVVLVPRAPIPFDVVIWGNRAFILKSGRYVEGIAFYGAVTADDHDDAEGPDRPNAA